MERLGSVTWRVLTVAIVVGLAFSTAIPEDVSTRSDTKAQSPEKSEEVGSQSIFWGLFALATVAMSQPSQFDADFQKDGSLLFPCKSSPLVCVADALGFVINLVFLVVIKRQGILDSMAGLQSDRDQAEDEAQSNAGGSSQPNPTSLTIRRALTLPTGGSTSWRKYPITSLVVILGASTQAIKIFAFQGRNVLWAKIAAGAFFGSYLVIGLFSLPKRRTDIRLHRLHPADRLIQTWLLSYALYVHGLIACYALYCSNQYLIKEVIKIKDCASYNGPASFLYCFLWGFVTSAFSIWIGAVFFFFLFVPILIFIGSRGLTDQTVIRGISGAIGVAATLPAILLFFQRPDFVTDVTSSVLQGAMLLIGALLGFILVELLRRFIWQKIFLASSLQIWTISQAAWFDFALLNLAIVALYCSFGYDPKGTVKPAWTEKLG